MSASPEPSRGSAPKFMNEVAIEAVGGAIAALAIGWLGQIPALIGLVVGAVVASRIEPPAAAALRRLKRPSASSAVALHTESVSAIEPSSPGPTPVGLVPVEPPPPETLLAGPPPESTATQPTPPPSMAGRRGRRRPSLRSSLLVTGTAVLIVIAAVTLIDLVRGESLLGDRDGTFIPHVPDITDNPDPIDPDVSIPDVAGKTVDEARALLSDQGFGVAVQGEFSDVVPQGSVTRSDPPAGDQAAKGSKVNVFVSKGPGVPVPEVAGTSVDMAQALLSEAGFEVAVEEEFSDAVPLGTVTRSDPAAEEQAAKGAKVSVFVSKGPGVPVPEVAGTSIDMAQALLSEAGFEVAVEEEFSDAVPPGTVTRSDPAAEEQAAKGAKVSVFVSKGAGVPVPEVVGKSVAEAQALLSEQGFGVAIEEEFSDLVPAGSVTRSDPASGQRAGNGTTVTIGVSKGPALSG